MRYDNLVCNIEDGSQLYLTLTGACIPATPTKEVHVLAVSLLAAAQLIAIPSVLLVPSRFTQKLRIDSEVGFRY